VGLKDISAISERRNQGGHGMTAYEAATEHARAVADSAEYATFVEEIFARFPWRRAAPRESLDRDYLRIVDHHLINLVPKVQPYMESGIRTILDFGCGSGGSAIALCLVDPDIRCFGTDIDPKEIEVARLRADLYGVADRCHFQHVEPSTALPFEPGRFDLSVCSSVLEYAIPEPIRRFCVQEMLRMVRPEGLLFFSVPNRLYPLEIHTRKLGWNYFPNLLGARTIDSSFWEVRSLARPSQVTLYQTRLRNLFTPWSNFCVKKLTG
jgi:SAM-dependent methyltransferase